MRQYVERAAFLSRFTIVWAKSQGAAVTWAPVYADQHMFVCMYVCGAAHAQVSTTLAPYDGGCLHTDILASIFVYVCMFVCGASIGRILLACMYVCVFVCMYDQSIKLTLCNVDLVFGNVLEH